MENKAFLTQIKRNNGVYEKGVVVKDSVMDAKQSMHAYFGAYGYGHVATTDYVACYIMDMLGNLVYREVDDRIVAPEPESAEE